MPTYKYTAMNEQGKKLNGTFKAANQNEVAAMIYDNKYYPVKIEEIIDRENQDIFEGLKKVTQKDLYIFCRQFYTMLNAGANISTCLNVLKDQSQNILLKKALNSAYEDVQKGIALSETFKKNEDVFPSLMINMIQAGEVTGKLDTIMERLASHFEREYKINNKIKSALSYPIILLILSIGVVTFLLIFIMPIFVGMFEGSGVELPLPTKIVLSISNFVRSQWYFILGLVFLIYYGLKYIGKTEKGREYLDSIKLKNPLTKSTNSKMILSRFTRTLSTALYSGIPLIDALEISSKVLGNSVIEKKIIDSKDKVTKGLPLTEALLGIDIFPTMFYSMVRIGEESGALDEILEKTADFYDEELNTALSKMTARIEPLMIIIMGLIIGFIVIAMYMPIFDITQTVA